MVSTRNHHFLFHSQSQPASLSNTLSLRTQGLGLCPLRDPVLSQPMTQIHSTAGLGQRGSGWQCLEKARAGGMCLGYGCKYVRILEAKHPSPRAGKPHRGQSPGRSAGSYSPTRCGTERETKAKAQEGRDLPRVLQLAGGRATSSGSRDTWISVPALLHLSKLQHLYRNGG